MTARRPALSPPRICPHCGGDVDQPREIPKRVRYRGVNYRYHRIGSTRHIFCGEPVIPMLIVYVVPTFTIVASRKLKTPA